MKQYEKRISEPREYDYLICRTCDLCGLKSNRASESEWNGFSYGVDETQVEIVVRQKEGSNYPEGGSGTKYDVDLCPKCFKEKLVPWLISQGARIKEEVWDW